MRIYWNRLEPIHALCVRIQQYPIVTNSDGWDTGHYWNERQSTFGHFKTLETTKNIGKSLYSIYLIYCAHTCKSLQRLEHRNSSSNHRELQQFARTKPVIFLLMWKYATDRQFGDGSCHFQQIQVLLFVEAYISSMYPQANGSSHQKLTYRLATPQIRSSLEIC